MEKDFCIDHSDCTGRIKRLEKEQINQWKKLDDIATKLNLVLGGIIISPFIVTVLILLIKAQK